MRASRATTTIGRGLTAAGLLVALIACTPGTGGITPAPSPSQASPSQAGSSQVADQPITLTLAYTDLPDMHEALIAEFHNQHPNITVNEQYTQFNDYVKTLKLTMSSDSPPDLAQYNTAIKDLVPTGLVVDMSAYEKSYDWTASFPKSALDVLRFDSSGKTFGAGGLYGVPSGLSLVGVYYNKELAAQAGITAAPTTFDQFEQHLKKAKDAGLRALEVGALDTNALHTWGAILDATMPTEDYRAWVGGQPGGNIVTPAAEQATQTFADWAKAGYIDDAALGRGEPDAATEFAAGKALFHVNGNWRAGQIADALGDKAGFFVMPPRRAGDPLVGTGFSVSYSMSSKSKNQDAAAAFLNFLASAEAAKIVADNGLLPANPKVAPAVTGVKGDVSNGMSEVAGDDGLVVFPDFAAPAMLDKLQSGIQSVIGDRMTPRAFLESLQEVRDAYHQN